jgi:hypothetical protein
MVIGGDFTFFRIKLAKNEMAVYICIRLARIRKADIQRLKRK